jgi:hypothetical protein
MRSVACSRRCADAGARSDDHFSSFFTRVSMAVFAIDFLGFEGCSSGTGMSLMNKPHDVARSEFSVGMTNILADSPH